MRGRPARPRRERRRNWGPPALAVLVAVLLAPGCEREGEARREGAPVLLVGVDGLEWDVLLPLVRQGRMPVLADLARRGVFGRLETQRPTESPILWTTIATGKKKGKHGIRGFIFREPGAEGEPPGPRQLYTSAHRRSKAFWNILSDQGRAVHCVGWWLTYPAETIEGVMVAQTNTLADIAGIQGLRLWKGSVIEGVEHQVSPTTFRPEVMRIVERVERELPRLRREAFGAGVESQDLPSARDWAATGWALRADQIYLGVARRILESGRPVDVLAVYLGGPDVVGHRFWRFMRPGEYRHPPDAREVEAFGEVIADYYQLVDAALGSLIERLPPGATVLVVSDHGMRPARRAKPFEPEPDGELPRSGTHTRAPAGVLIAAGSRIRPAGGPDPAAPGLEPSALPVVASILDVTPTLLALQGIPVGEDMDGRVREGLLAETWLREHPVRTVPTHDDEDWLRRHAARQIERPGADERMEQLRALGYIE